MTVIYRERLAAYRSGAAELVLLHGWASDAEIWRSIIPPLRRHFHITLIDLPSCGRSPACSAGDDTSSVIEQLLPVLPDSAIYCGWSLGGMFATAIAAKYPERVSALITVASNAVFVADEVWPAAMPSADFLAFEAAIEKNVVKGLRRFRSLQLLGDQRADSVAAILRRQPIPVNASALTQGLKYLNALDNCAALAAIRCPVIHVFGSEDALVPVASAELFAANYADHKCSVMMGCGHIPFLSSPQEFIDTVVDFVNSWQLLDDAKPYHLNKSDIGRSFSRAASSYDGAAQLQRRIADKLVSFLPALPSETLLDLGCGTGYSLPALRQYIGGGKLLAGDLAPGMLAYAKGRYAAFADGWLCADAEDLPLTDSSVNQIFSSLALQWCENLPAVYAEIERVLKPGGSAVIATLGPDTLHELRESWRRVDGYEHVNQFAPQPEILSAIENAGLKVEEWQEVRELMQYERLSDLTRELKNIGAHNVNSGRPGGLTSRGRIKALTAAYEQFREPGGRLPATYQVWYLRCTK
ncbi:malonyl-ACP O-methyltransferase BioC [Zhongshania arctica]|uniref:Malonyl-[acyl-carrier protein] O-methyltransferase n=1 Tax=Zhongshania arctica TaxID=3238302 RepID=A0ABV3TYY0_9GAMM